VLNCTSCGQENPEGARFCNACGAALVAADAALREERKVVTVLFADLVGFTSRAERLDPEEVRAVLQPYHARLRSELERFGGTVEKFIGDAVMALFGAPVAHEDDPERAVRAAMAIREWIGEQGEDLQVRIAVNTGEALVALGARPSEGEGMAAGDVVNTAARMQASAPVNGILVGEQTQRATVDAIDYREAEPVVGKGKSEPIRVWEALQARSRFGEVIDRTRAPLIGRRRELELLGAIVGRVREERSPQLVTLVGVPGIGKSRLLFELRSALDDSDVMTWWQGRSLPYGEGVTFWALGEIAKQQTGILESDRDEEAAGKLRRSTRELLPEADVGWVEAHLRPLVGLGAGGEVVGTRREEAFAAWRRFLEAIAERGTTVVVFEDLHWADEGLLDFVDYLAEWTSGVPLLVICTARPELLARRSDWGGGKTNATTLALAPLTGDETAHLVHALLERAVLPAETQRALVERADGNPLYAEEFARLVAEQGPAVEALRRLPETVQGIIAARLDALPVEEKVLLQDAAVVGKVFWLGALCGMQGIERAEAERRLHALERKEFIRRERHASVAGEAECDFRHILVRDVAYGQIPRAERAERHLRSADWIESLGRPDDHAEMLAYHYLTALELDRAARREDSALAERARPALERAGDRAVALGGYEAAARFYASALELCADDHPERPQLLLRQGRALRDSEGSGLDFLTEALASFRASGDDEGVAEAASAAAHLLWSRGERDEAYAYVNEAVELVSDRPQSAATANVLLQRSAFHLVTGEFPETLRLARAALPIVDRLGLEARRARALNLIGWARLGMGDAGGLSDLEEALEIALAADVFEHLHSSFENLRSGQYVLGLLADASATLTRSAEVLERLAAWERRWLEELRAAESYRQGRWDEALGLAGKFLDEVEAGSPHYLEPPCRSLRASIRLARGDSHGAVSDTERALEVAERAKDDQVLSHALSGRAIAALAENRREEANDLASRLESISDALLFGMTFGWPTLADVAWLMTDLDRRPDLLRILDGIPVASIWIDAARAIAGGEFPGAAELLGGIGDAPGEAYARLRAAEALIAAGRRAEAEEPLQKALVFYREVGATAYVRKGEALLAVAAAEARR
jgi:class 3 adenylate cyclase/tetratricopeptide (TPR) repeat protein